MLVGHLIAAGLFNRSGMSIPRAPYSFIRERYWQPMRLWDTCRYESWVISGVCSS